MVVIESFSLFQAYVAQATAIVKEQERLIDQIRGEAGDSPFVQRALQAAAKASSACLEQEALIREIDQTDNGDRSGSDFR